MKMKKLIAMLMVVGMAVAMLSACGGSKEEEAKKIESADDLEGAKIGVQTGTTGDIYITDDYGDENVERYNKGFEAVRLRGCSGFVPGQDRCGCHRQSAGA